MLELPSYERTSPETTFMYTPSEQSDKDIEGLSVFQSDSHLDDHSVYTESDKCNPDKKGYRIFGVLPYYFSVFCIAITVSLIALAIGLVLYFYLRNSDYQRFQAQIHSECSNRATVSVYYLDSNDARNEPAINLFSFLLNTKAIEKQIRSDIYFTLYGFFKCQIAHKSILFSGIATAFNGVALYLGKVTLQLY